MQLGARAAVRATRAKLARHVVAKKLGVRAVRRGPSRPQACPPVSNLEVGKYGNLARRSVKDGLTPDHIPSYAALRGKVESELGRKLTAAEARQLRNSSNSMVVDTRLHQLISRTYGGRNTQTQILQDAGNLGQAARLDLAAYEQSLLNAGYTQAQVSQAFSRLHNLNRSAGIY